MNRPSSGRRRTACIQSGKKAFSLVEVVLALGVVGFSVVAIFSLFPVGLKSALESRRETRAAYLAEQIISDLRSTPFDAATLLYRKSDGQLDALTPFSLASTTTLVLGCDGTENIVKTLSSAIYTSGINDSAVEYLVQVKVEPAAFSNLAKVSVEISAPAAAPLAGRSRYGFFTTIGRR